MSKTQLTLAMDEELADRIRRDAEAQSRSMSQQMVYLIKLGLLADQPKEHADAQTED
jgi:hypothetical protein|tara:strand:+ start:1046 stop:1216 length:171 start_codon:yes stop_codon:yes gene_type:complete